MLKKNFIAIIAICSITNVYGQVFLKENKISRRDALSKVCDTIKYALHNLLKNSELDDKILDDSIRVEFNDVSIEFAFNEIVKGLPVICEIQHNSRVVYIRPKIVRYTINGIVLNNKDEPLKSATIKEKRNKYGTTTDEEGRFRLYDVRYNDTLVISSIGYSPIEKQITNSGDIKAVMNIIFSELEEVASTGYQNIKKKRLTGAVEIRQVYQFRGPNEKITSLVEYNMSSVLPIKTLNNSSSEKLMLMRGRGTIYAGPDPLIVVDNFAYDGDINNINPNDIESISLLKDAASASIWGARASNGVLVYKQKEAAPGYKYNVQFSSYLAYCQKPDLYQISSQSIPEYIDLEKNLFKKGFYTSLLDQNNIAFSPVIETLLAEANGRISPFSADSIINNLAKQDVRNDLKKYIYRNNIKQQYSINISGSEKNINYYTSFGYDQNTGNTINAGGSRYTYALKLSSALFKLLKLTTGINYANSTLLNATDPGIKAFPYSKLVNQDGTAAAVARGYRVGYIDSVVASKNFLDWKYWPLEDVKLNNDRIKQSATKIDVGIHINGKDIPVKMIQDFSMDVQYQHNQWGIDVDNILDEKSWYTRNLVNSFAQDLQKPVPTGNILEKGFIKSKTSNYRYQLNYHKNWGLHSIDGLAAIEGRKINADSSFYQIYGKTESFPFGKDVDYKSSYPMSYNPFEFKSIPDKKYAYNSNENYFSYLSNIAWSYANRYIVSASVRKDEANILGVRTNRKGIPLTSYGVLWNIANEKFYNFGVFPILSMHGSWGYGGNLSRSATAITIIDNPSRSTYNSPNITPTGAPNVDLRWEKTSIINLGFNLATKKGRVRLNFDYYNKKSFDLVGYIQPDQTTGVSSYFGNHGIIRNSGFDLSFFSSGKFQSLSWESSLFLTHNTSIVKKYNPFKESLSKYFDLSNPIPVQGKPLNSIYSYKFYGLDASNGDPFGYYNNQPSKNYKSIAESKDISELVYNGPQLPTWFGSIINGFSIKQVTLSFKISFKLGYYFKKKSVNYDNLLSGELANKDYSLRWQKPGDELVTHVPSQVFEQNAQRSHFYENASINVEKADHIRLQDIQVSYDLLHASKDNRLFQQLHLYFFIGNVGIIWRSNKSKTDPDIITGFPEPKIFSFGIKANFKQKHQQQ